MKTTNDRKMQIGQLFSEMLDELNEREEYVETEKEHKKSKAYAIFGFAALTVLPIVAPAIADLIFG